MNTMYAKRWVIAMDLAAMAVITYLVLEDSKKTCFAFTILNVDGLPCKYYYVGAAAPLRKNKRAY